MRKTNTVGHWLIHLYTFHVSVMEKVFVYHIVQTGSRLTDIWAMLSEKGVFEHAQKNTDSDSACACAKSHPGIFSPLIHSLVSNNSVSGQRRP